jgi:DNA mismatch repair endonuclease MutH
MPKYYQTKADVIREAQKILNKSLRDLMRAQDIIDIENQLVSYGAKRKGFLGELVEKFVFELEKNNKSEADFNVAGVELKTNPLKRHSAKKYISKERLVFSMINYDEIVRETWETSSFRKKNEVLLILFYLWVKEQSILDYKFKFTYLMNLLEDISDADIFQIRKDWEYIVAKIKRGEAHLLSEGDTYYLGACTKAANSMVVKDQPMSHILAKPRAFSLKQQYLNFIIQKELLGREANTDSIFKKVRRVESVEDAFKEKLLPFLGKTDMQIRKSLKWSDKTIAKNYKRLLVNKMLGVSSNKIVELEKANITLKVITLEHSGTLKESMSFPAFDYIGLATQEWYDKKNETMTDFHLLLETKKFLFVIFQKKKKSTEIVFKKMMFWNFPMSDIEKAKTVWDKTRKCIRNGEYDKLPKMTESEVAHVRPHGKDSGDTIETPQGTMEMKRCFWLNAKYIQRVLENADLKP